MTIADRPPHRSVQARLRIRLLTKDAWRPHRQGEKKSAARAPGKSRTCATQFGNASPLKEKEACDRHRGEISRGVLSPRIFNGPSGPSWTANMHGFCAEQGRLRVD